MFGRKKKRIMLAMLDESGNEILRLPVKELTLPEEAVLQMSIRYFNDPDPCFIHREAVRQRAVMELMEHTGSFPLSELSEEVRLCFQQGTKLRIWEEGQ